MKTSNTTSVSVGATYIDPKSFNDFVKKRNNGERTRYYTASFILDKNFVMPEFAPQDSWQAQGGHWESTYYNLFYTVTGPRKVQAVPHFGTPILKSSIWQSSDGKYRFNGREYDDSDFKDYLQVTVKFSIISPEGKIFDDGSTARHNAAFTCLCSHYFNQKAYLWDNWAKGAYIKMDEDLYNQRKASVVHKDRYDVPIDIGDVVMYCNGQGSMWPFIVSSIEPETVNRKRPENLIVIDTNNSAKKPLKWGLTP